MNELEATGRCVKCGLCLPHCPTFKLSGNEADSPRGRIALMQAMAEDATLYSPGLATHLDGCLECRACEAMCPSQVPFGDLMDAARAELEKRRHRSRGARLLRRFGLGLLAGGAGRIRRLAGLLRLYRRSGLQSLARKSGLLRGGLRRLDGELVRTPRPPARASDGDVDTGRTTLRLFTGCAGTWQDGDTLDAVARLLDRLGYRVEIPSQQVCCGAIHHHNADADNARRLAQANGRAFGGDDTPLITSASGCGAHLRDYERLYPGAVPAGFGRRVTDIHAFLAAQAALQALPLEPLAETVAVHIPCSQRNVLKQDAAVFQVLEAIPGIRLLTLNPEGGCCGAAGSYFLTQPATADRLRDDTLASVEAQPPTRLVTTNIGCALHLAAGVEARGWPTEVLHPVTLLARQLREP